jgi:hypothetical protein
LGLTAVLIARRFVFTFTENPAKETAVFAYNQFQVIFPPPRVE